MKLCLGKFVQRLWIVADCRCHRSERAVCVLISAGALLKDGEIDDILRATKLCARHVRKQVRGFIALASIKVGARERKVCKMAIIRTRHLFEIREDKPRYP